MRYKTIKKLKRELNKMRYPDLSHESVISIDIETREHNFSTLGPSNYRSTKGYILGVAIATNNHAEYYNYDNPIDKQYIKDVMKLNSTKIGHSLIYDIDWLESEGITVNGRLHDIMIAEALIDNEKSSYSLDSIAQDYLNETKSEQELEDYLLQHNSIKTSKTKPVQNYLYLLPHILVRKYAIQDVNIPLKVFKKQQAIINSMGLGPLFELESDLIKVLLYMRKTGALYDSDISQQCTNEINKIYSETKRLLKENYGNPNVNSTDQIAYVMDKLDISYPYTDKGNPSIRREYLEYLIEQKGYEHYSVIDFFPSLVHSARRLGKSERDYITGIRENFVGYDGLIRCSFHQTRDQNNYGTVSGRFSCSKPNLQQMTSKDRDDFLGGLVRRAFIPTPGHDWLKIDYSQIEYRFIAHYAKGPGSKEIRDNYNYDPNTDYHQYIQDLTGLDRPIAKNLNFGIAFGMGSNKMAKLYGWDAYKTYEILSTYHDNAPFVKYTMQDVGRAAVSRGYIKTILGRRAQCKDKRKSYVMFNRLIQGSAADLLKKAMVDIYKSGILKQTPLHLTVHDELDFSVPKGGKQKELIKDLVYIMENAIKLRVPVVAEASIGPNWGDVEKVA